MLHCRVALLSIRHIVFYTTNKILYERLYKVNHAQFYGNSPSKNRQRTEFCVDCKRYFLTEHQQQKI